MRSAAELEEVVGSRPAATILKVIDHLDDHCREFLNRSPYAVATVFDDSDPLGAPRTEGVADPSSSSPDRLDLPGLTHGAEGASVGVVALVPGYGETVRVNGRLGLEGGPHVRVEEAYLHCAKCVIRSKLWADVPEDQKDLDASPSKGADLDAVPGARELLARSPFVALGTVDASGGADASPKGDPAGFVEILDATTLAVPDRPGNRRTDTFHNLVERPEIAMLAVVPGLETVLEIRGTARVSRDEELRKRMVVQRNVPKVAVLIDVTEVELRPDPAIARLWAAEERIAPGDLPRAARIWTDHLALNQTSGEPAPVAEMYTAEQALATGLEQDYTTGVY
ncbi:hypothetical protein GCM10010197_13570 [Nocardioides luteus]|uniref:Pyridoxamine 5'-phosphate oxidase N-terminal domain-containing protein n=1 Tax=Nocardioides luteus TaxID=1844 RepID=A0ABQ5SVH6_9ACTN|nr:hypothetical protein GCM10010197_13570 [Nocardioides luteus]GLJ67620.1 hypothetical protein GCM10017579_16560 [Nocardioides luteus]